MLAYQSTFSTLVLKEHKGSEYAIAWKSKRLFRPELYSLHNVFLPIKKWFGSEIGIQFNNTPLIIYKNNYRSKIVNAWAYFLIDHPQPRN